MSSRFDHHSEPIADLWDRLVRDEPIPEVTDLDPASVSDAVRLLAAARAQTQAGARERALAAAQSELLASRNGKGHSVESSLSLPGQPRRLRPSVPRVPSRAPVRGSLTRAVSWIGAAALLLALLGSAFFALRPDPRAIMPPIQSDATPEASPSADVTMYKGNPARTGVNPGPAPQGNPVILWTALLGSAIRSSPAVVGDSVFVGTDAGLIVAVDRATGTERWRFTASSQVNSSPAVVDGMLYAGSEAGVLYALDAATGTEVWSSTAAVPNAGPVVDGGVVYMGSVDGNVYALDAKSGTEIWRSPLGVEAAKSPALADGILYVGDVDAVFHALDASTGEELWLHTPVDGTPMISNGVVFIGGSPAENEFFIYALDAKTGTELWRSQRPDIPAPATAGADAIFVPSYDGTVYSLDWETGAELWSYKTRDYNNAPGALVGDEVIFASHDFSLRSFDTGTGAVNWEFALDGEVQFGPAVTGGVIYVGTFGGTLYAIGGDGQPLAAPPSPVTTTEVSASPAPTGGSISAELLWASSAVDGQFGPAGFDVAPDGTLYAADGDRQRIGIFDANGVFREWWGEPGSGPGQFAFSDSNSVAGDVGFDADGNIYVFDSLNSRIQKFTPDRTFIKQWGTFGTESGQFGIHGGNVDVKRGLVYVIDYQNHRIQVFDLDGTFVDKWGSRGTQEGQFNYPSELAIGPVGLVYVIEEEGRRIQVFDQSGRFIRAIGVGVNPDGVPLGRTYGIAVDPSGVIYVTDTDNQRIVVFANDGRLIGTIGDIPGFGPIKNPAILELAEDGALYVGDGAGQVLKLRVTVDAS